MLSRHSRGHFPWSAIVLFAIIALARVVYISLFATDTPFADQWDSEAALLLKPWQDGTWQISQLFSAHNEHRIALTRLLTLALFELNNGQWDNLVEAYVNVVIAALTLTLLYSLLARHGSSIGRWVLFAAVALIGALPFSWENFLTGFQSVFYLMTLLAIVMISVAAFRPATMRSACLLFALACLSLFTAASGLVGCISVVVVILMSCIEARTVDRAQAVTIGLMLLTSVFGIYITPVVGHHAALKAVGIREHLDALTTALMWPLQPIDGKPFSLAPKVLAAIAMWSPTCLRLAQFARSRKASPGLRFAIGIAAWVFLQSIAIAHSRGHLMAALSPRYMEISALGMAINAWLVVEYVAMKEHSLVARRAAFVACAALLGVGGYGLVSRWTWDFDFMVSHGTGMRRATANLAKFIETHDSRWIDQPGIDLAYPAAGRLRKLASDPTILAMLPPSIRHPLDTSPGSGSGFRVSTVPLRLATSATAPAYGTDDPANSRFADALYKSGPLRSRFGHVIISSVGTHPSTGNIRLALIGEHGAHSFWPVAHSSERWRRGFATVPSGIFWLEAADNSPDAWLAFMRPTEAGLLSTSAMLLQEGIRGVTFRLLPSLRDRAEDPPAPEFISARAPLPAAAESGGDCAVDLVDGQAVGDTPMPIHGPLMSVRGWAALSAGTGLANDAIFLELTEPTGKTRLETTKTVPRPDVASAFNQPRLANTGYEAYVDIRNDSGLYRIRIVQRNGARLVACDAKAFSVIISR